jgi:hypothetical protein
MLTNMENSMTSKLFTTIAELTLAQLLLGTLSALVVSVVASAVYDAHVGPLSKFPGPKLRAISSIPKAISIFRGREHEDYVALHIKYGNVIRVAPNELSFAGGAAV